MTTSRFRINRDRDDITHYILMTVFWIVAASVVVLAVVAIVNDDTAERCRALGGEPKTQTHVTSGTGVGVNGKPVVVTGTTTTHLCVAPDGHLIYVGD